MRKAQRPIDVKDTPWSHIGKDALDAAAERVWNMLRDAGQMHNASGGDMGPYHVQSSASQDAAHRAVLALLGSAVPKMLREHAKEAKKNGASTEYADALFDLADELDAAHG